MPIAVISGASRGALRSRRYASRSMMTPVRPHRIIAPSIVTTTTTISSGPVTMPVRPAAPRIVEREERAQRVHVAMGEVDQLDDPVDHRVAERDQGVDAAQRETVDQLLEEEGPKLFEREHRDRLDFAAGV